ncbi:MAG: exonuclease SbcCD subunit D [Candidatus Thorarchaeota archaeon]
MGEDYIRFMHISDSHFGVHYALKPKNLIRRAYGELFFQKVTDVIQKAISDHDVDFIIHSGDFFNRSKPPPEVVDRAVKAFQPAIKKEIPIYILPGNHERSRLPLGLLPFSNGNINLFKKPSSFIFEKNGIIIKLAGFPYIRKDAKRQFSSVVKKAWFQCNDRQTKKPDYSILVIHQLIEGSCIENYTFKRGYNVVSFKQIPPKFNYIACGHVHRFQFLYSSRLNSIQSTNKFYSVKQDYNNHSWQFNSNLDQNSPIFRNPLISYAGSLERVSLTERVEPKGYLICQLQPLKKGIQSIDYRFNELPAIIMRYFVWDLYKASIVDYVNQTLDILYRIHKGSKASQKQREKGVIAILRIKIRGRGNYSKKDIKYLKQEARRCNIFLSFSFRFQEKKKNLEITSTMA